MGRPRRQIHSREVYEICMRTMRGLPFVCTTYMKLILESVTARVQRDSKVLLCHYLWMSNHPHYLVVAQDKQQCTRFYGEIQKQLTEAVKRLTGIEHLNLWKRNGVSVIHYGDTEGVIERIAYLYANPARANLVESIDKYPGLSSWKEYQASPDKLDAEQSKLCPWVRAPYLSKLPCRALSPKQDAVFTDKLLSRTQTEHKLVLKPNAWMVAHGVSESSRVEEINTKIVNRLKAFEHEAREKRRLKGKRVKGASKLRVEPLDLRYKSKSTSIRIHVYALDERVRKRMLRHYDAFQQACEKCWKRWKLGDFTVLWPPGAFVPAAPPRANYFDTAI